VLLEEEEERPGLFLSPHTRTEQEAPARKYTHTHSHQNPPMEHLDLALQLPPLREVTGLLSHPVWVLCYGSPGKLKQVVSALFSLRAENQGLYSPGKLADIFLLVSAAL